MTTPRTPRPLPLHLVNALAAWGGAGPAALGFLSGSLHFCQQVKAEAEALRARIPADQHAEFATAVSLRAQNRLRDHLRGIELYRDHPFRRSDTLHRLIWQAGSARLLDYGAQASGKPVLLVPSLVNPAYILDLMPGHSLVAYLRSRGLRPILLDWGAPAGEECGFDGSDLLSRRLLPAFDALVAEAGRPSVVGYCMGGTLSLALAAHRRSEVDRLALLAAPWDFHADPSHAAPRLAPYLTAQLSALGPRDVMPVDWMQCFFASLDPTLDDRKFRRFAAMDPSSADARFFVAMEDWTNSGPPLARGVAQMCLADWYRDNLPGRGRWVVAGKRIQPETLELPVLVTATDGDRLVPRDVAASVSRLVPHATRLDPEAGHVGMVVGRRARQALWAPLAGWLLGPVD